MHILPFFFSVPSFPSPMTAMDEASNTPFYMQVTGYTSSIMQLAKCFKVVTYNDTHAKVYHALGDQIVEI